MEMNLDELSKVGLSYQEDITISSMCTVFAESEVVSLIAQNKATDDIVHGLNKAVAGQNSLPRETCRRGRGIYDDWRCCTESGSCQNVGGETGNEAGDQR